MKYEFEKVIEGISKYINDEIYAGMNDLQEFTARVFIGRFLNNQDNIKDMLLNNGFIKTFGIIDSNGMVDVKALITDVKRELARKGKVTFDIPWFGKYTFTPSDADVLCYAITGEELKDESH
jgi:hypothetical protein